MSVAGNCAHFHKGGWWYNACGQANLNGVWYTGGVYRSKFQDGIFWAEYGGGFYSMKSVRMLIRPIDWGRQRWAKLENNRDSIEALRANKQLVTVGRVTPMESASWCWCRLSEPFNTSQEYFLDFNSNSIWLRAMQYNLLLYHVFFYKLEIGQFH